MANTNTGSALVRSLEKSLEIKTLKDLVRVKTNETPVLLIDVSGSMGHPMRNGKTRIAGLREVVTGMQAKRPTQMIAFGLEPNRPHHDPTGLEMVVAAGSEVAFVTDVPDAQGGTPMAEAIEFARMSGFGRAVIISDGSPNDTHGAMEAARQFGGRIDVVYVGDPGDPGSMFLESLAKETGGQRFEGDLSEVKELQNVVVGLLTGDVEMEEVDEDDDDEDEDDEDEDDEDEDDEEA